MAVLVTAIHVSDDGKTWMAGTRPAAGLPLPKRSRFGFAQAGPAMTLEEEHIAYARDGRLGRYVRDRSENLGMSGSAVKRL
jgi:hypothetical protein